MTHVEPTRLNVRDCHLYRFWVRHPVTGERVLGYVGETVRMPFERLMEHVYSQPWADTIVAWEVDDIAYPGKRAVLAAEAVAIRREKPLYNVEHNTGNPRRIIPPDAIRQRRARDAQQGRPRWVHPDDRAARTVPERRVAATRTWRAWQVKAGLWSAAWVMTTAATLAGFQQFGVAGSWPVRTLCACLTGAGLLVWGLGGAPTTRRQWRRARRRGARRWLRW